jgi:F-type H+-transporting ATPase subunit epsilon
MINSSFRLKIVTPTRIFEREIKHIRLKDATGFFGIMNGHVDFLTILLPSLGYYTDINDNEVFFAVDGGIFRVKEGVITLTSRGVFESEQAGKLSETIEETIFKRDKTERSFSAMLKGIERAFIEKTIEFERGI